ncbi:hypothetical protein SERLA73DRAFT_138143 [Serpula lacrymans var. lacrymans S7.3]|uniref:Uncharacterized protein n=1 Tax=Serpula lacrymans var. lacrymans (strain S7.3) TaxID=936435 RepID=F8Q0X0_SERL3|nr:hypothetical protein SERLA73DRAFT_138143 [Serpula lacrymans var. lacrymans S7.3]
MACVILPATSSSEKAGASCDSTFLYEDRNDDGMESSLNRTARVRLASFSERLAISGPKGGSVGGEDMISVEQHVSSILS